MKYVFHSIEHEPRHISQAYVLPQPGQIIRLYPANDLNSNYFQYFVSLDSVVDDLEEQINRRTFLRGDAYMIFDALLHLFVKKHALHHS